MIRDIDGWAVGMMIISDSGRGVKVIIRERLYGSGPEGEEGTGGKGEERGDFWGNELIRIDLDC